MTIKIRCRKAESMEISDDDIEHIDYIEVLLNQEGKRSSMMVSLDELQTALRAFQDSRARTWEREKKLKFETQDLPTNVLSSGTTGTTKPTYSIIASFK